MRVSEIISCKKEEVWECFLEEVGFELDFKIFRIVIFKVLKVLVGVWFWGKILLVLDFYEVL